MNSKDYYKILEVTPAATALEIKRSYRRLALKYHPDKNWGNKLYEVKLQEINEAYRVLSNTQKRTDYNYSRTSTRNTQPRPTTPPPVTAQTILLQAKKLKSKTAAADPGRMNKEALFQQVKQLLAKANLELIKAANSEKMNAEFVECIISINRDVPYSNVRKIIFTLVRVAGANNDLLLKIQAFERRNKNAAIWDKYKMLVALIAAFLFCLLIYFISI